MHPIHLKSLALKLKQICQSPVAIMLLIALIVAIRITIIQHGWVNNDSLVYFECARLILHADWNAAFKLYNWLLYPALIAGMHLLTNFDIQTSAQTLNILFFMLFTWGFLLIIKEAGGKVSHQIWGGMLLISTQYIVGDILGMLLRDQGFWAGYVWGLYFLLSYMREGKYHQALLFQLSMMLATLFRLEAIVYLVILPALVCNISHHQTNRIRICRTLSVISLPLIVGVLLMIAVVSGLLDPNKLGRLNELIKLIQYGFVERIALISEKADILGKLVLGKHLDDYALFSLWSSLMLIVLMKTIKVAGWPVLFLLIAGRKGWSRIRPHAQSLFSMQLMIGLITSILIIVNTFVLSSRYVIASGIVILVIAAFTTEAFYQHAGVWLKRCLLIILSLMLLANLYDKPFVDLDRQAVEYIQSINQNHAPVLYDTENARFYADQPFQKRIPSIEYVQAKLEHQDISHYTYLMITIKHNNEDYEKLITKKLAGQFHPIKTLYGWRKKDKVVIYTKDGAF